MDTIGNFVKCKQCDYSEADYGSNYWTKSKSIMCRRCGYGETWDPKYDKDGKSCGWKHEISPGAGVLWYRDTGETNFTNEPLSPSKDVPAAENWLRERLANCSIEAETAYLTRWNDLTKKVEIVVGDFEWPNRLMDTLGLNCLAAEPGQAVRFAILPVKVAIVAEPYCAILPVVHYLNADPVNGRYEKNADGSWPPAEWEIRHLGLSLANVKKIENLLCQHQTPFDIDIVMYKDGPFGRDFDRINKQARWKASPEFAAEVEKAAIEASNAFETTLFGKSGVTILDDFRGAWTMTPIRTFGLVPTGN